MVRARVTPFDFFIRADGDNALIIYCDGLRDSAARVGGKDFPLTSNRLTRLRESMGFLCAPA
jgi:hypothetical protein